MKDTTGHRQREYIINQLCQSHQTSIFLVFPKVRLSWARAIVVSTGPVPVFFVPGTARRARKWVETLSWASLSPPGPGCCWLVLPSDDVKISTEHGHRNSEFAKETGWFSIAIFHELPEGNMENPLSVSSNMATWEIPCKRKFRWEIHPSMLDFHCHAWLLEVTIKLQGIGYLCKWYMVWVMYGGWWVRMMMMMMMMMMMNDENDEKDDNDDND